MEKKNKSKKIVQINKQDKRKKRLYRLTYTIKKKGGDIEEHTILYRGIDSIHASSDFYNTFGRRRSAVNITSAVLAENEVHHVDN